MLLSVYRIKISDIYAVLLLLLMYDPVSGTSSFQFGYSTVFSEFRFL